MPSVDRLHRLFCFYTCTGGKLFAGMYTGRSGTAYRKGNESMEQRKENQAGEVVRADAVANCQKKTDGVLYRQLNADEIDRALFAHFIRHQNVTLCHRRVNGAWVIREDPFIDDWTEEDYRILVDCLKNTVRTGGFVYGAFVDGVLKGFHFRGGRTVRRGQSVSGSVVHSCVRRYAGQKDRADTFSGCRRLGGTKRRG